MFYTIYTLLSVHLLYTDMTRDQAVTVFDNHIFNVLITLRFLLN